MNRLAAVIAVVLALPLLAFAALLILVANPETFREEIETGFEAGTGWGLEVGSMQWRYFPPISLDLTEISIDNGSLATLRSASVDVALLPLAFGGSLELQGVSVDGLELNLVQRADGTNNWTPAGQAPDQTEDIAPDATSASSGPESLRINNVAITNLRVVYTDEAAQARTEAALHEFHATNIGYGAPFDFSFAGTLEQGPDLALNASGRATVELDPGLTRIGIEELEIEKDVTLGSIHNVRTTLSVAGDVDLEGDVAAIHRYALTVPGGRIEGSANVANLRTSPAAAGELSVTLRPRETLRAAGLEDALPPGPGTFDAFRVTASVKASANGIQLTAIDGSLDDTTIKGSVEATLETIPALAFDLDVGPLDLTGFAADESAGDAASAAAQANTPLEDSEVIPVEALRSLEADGRIRIERLATAELQLKALAFGVILKSAKLTSTFAARAYGGSIDWQAKVNAQNSPITRLEAHVVGVDLTGLTGSDWITGTLKLDSSLSMRGAMLSEVLGSIDGSSRYDVQDGTLDVTPIKGAAGVVDSLRGEVSGVAKWPDTIEFKNLTGTHSFDEGARENQRLDFSIETVRGVGEGGFDLFANTVDYDLYVVLENVEGSQLRLDDGVTGIRWPLACRGPLSEPAKLCRPDGAGLRRMVSDIAKKEITGRARDKLLEKLPESVKDKARDALKGLFR